jgi:sugar phosphate isomerase/epimerase
MMKLGCCLNMNASLEPKIGAESIPVIAARGFDYIELPLAQVMELSGEGFRDLLDKIRNGGIPVEACNNFFPPRVRLTGEEAKQETALEYAKAACERAAAMGAKIVVLGSSGAKNIPLGFPYERARGQLVELLGKIQDTVKPLEITVVLEPLNQKESNFVINAGEGLGLVRELNLDNVKLLVDYYHLRMENEDPSVIRKAGKDLRHVHIASKEGRRFPKAGDGEDYTAFFRELKSICYGGRISIEGYSENLGPDAEAAKSLLRPLMN